MSVGSEDDRVSDEAKIEDAVDDSNIQIPKQTVRCKYYSKIFALLGTEVLIPDRLSNNHLEGSGESDFH